MDIATILQSQYLIGLSSLAFGIIGTVIVNALCNKRSLFTYNVRHSQIGLSAHDSIYGTVQLSWNNQPVARLYLSTVELHNASSKDFDSVIVRIFSNNTILLTEKAHIVGTTRNLEFSDDYKNKIAVQSGQEPTDEQFDLYRHQRDYIIPIMNRGEKIKIEVLNTPEPNENPVINLDLLHKGVRCKFKIDQPLFMGEPQETSARVGSVLGLVVVLVLLYFVSNIWVAGITAYFVGWAALFVGAFAIKIFKKLRYGLSD
ncbi:MAG: hypothetical protein GDA55_03270 [Cellvibrionales bacterium]|nr:hypothetical protein [Cellvibrionales bacterium]